MMDEERDEPLLPDGGAIEREAWPAMEAPRELRERLLVETSRVIRQRSGARRARRVLAAGALYAAGLATGVTGVWAIREAPMAETTEIASKTTPSVGVVTAPARGAVEPIVSAEPVDSAIQFADMDPVERLSLALARATPEEQLAILRDAGDRFLEEGRYTPATNCYRKFLEVEEALHRNPELQNIDDTWLLASLRPSQNQGD